TGFVFTNTITPNNQYGVSGDGTSANPMGTLTTYFPGSVVAGNVLPGGAAASYPPNNFFPATLADVGFANLAGGNYHLAAGSPYKNAGTDGKDIGANIDAIGAATGFAVSGINPAAQPAPPTVSITPASTDFGTITVGRSADRAFTVTNLGGSTVSGTVAGEAGQFAVASGASFSLPPGASQAVVVRFTPTDAVAYGTTIDIAWGTGSVGRVVTGTGTPESPGQR
ncbi:MAG TPA: choice-of-anchor D domain-containing protein, partial [bacterium]